MVAVGIAAAMLPASAFAAGSLAGQTIVIDPGHGGIDGGATAFGRVEKMVTLPIGLDLNALLRGAGARVVMTRSDDRFVSLAARSAIANAAGADTFVSIHANSLSDPNYSGVTTFYGAPSGFVTGVTRAPSLVAASRALAGDVQAAVQARTGAINRGMQPADYYVLGNARMPAILIETGFITNPAEGQRLIDPAYQQALAAGIADGLAQFATNPGRAVPTATGAASTPDATSTAPATGQYVVRSGDTLSAIAVRFGVTESSLRATNSLSNANVIFAGRTLDVPNTAAAGSPPTGTAGPNAASTSLVSAPGGPPGTYTVRAGDTLSGIAVRLGTTEAALRVANALSNNNLIYAGQRLAISAAGPALATQSPTINSQIQATAPGSRRYRIRAGDTLSGIALRLGISENALIAANQLTDLNRLIADRYLQIPGGN